MALNVQEFYEHTSSVPVLFVKNYSGCYVNFKTLLINLIDFDICNSLKLDKNDDLRLYPNAYHDSYHLRVTMQRFLFRRSSLRLPVLI
jgi:hypothetical protein